MPSSRLFHAHSARFNAEQQPPRAPKGEGEGDAEGASSSRKPLSRIAIGSKKAPQTIKHDRNAGMVNWKAMSIFLVVGAGLTWYFQREKKRLETRRREEEAQAVGRPSIGGPFKLIDQNGNTLTNEDLLGKFCLLYFGFSMCPDICPEELDKMAEILNDINKPGQEKIITPVFITCDPARDSPEVLKEYLQEFHPDIIGLTGSYDEIKDVCKKFRVYFSTPADVKPGDEYLVDHSIFFYLMDPEGKFLEALGKNFDAVQSRDRIMAHVDAWIPSAEREKQKQGFFSRFF